MRAWKCRVKNKNKKETGEGGQMFITTIISSHSKQTLCCRHHSKSSAYIHLFNPYNDPGSCYTDCPHFSYGKTEVQSNKYLVCMPRCLACKLPDSLLPPPPFCMRSRGSRLKSSYFTVSTLPIEPFPSIRMLLTVKPHTAPL